jgi:hypothetical protein
VFWAVHVMPVPSQSATEVHSTQVPETHLGVEPLQTLQVEPQALALDCVLTHEPPQRSSPGGQSVAQPMTPSVRHSYMQLIVVPVLQVPVPSQVLAEVNVEFVHEAGAPHGVPPPGKTQLLRFAAVPSQTPAQAPLPPQGVRGVVTGTQAPTFPGAPQDSHWPLHAESQQ